jgi:cytochrome P450
VISALILVEQDGDFLTTDEILTTCILLFITGEETTVNALGNGMLALLRNPDQMDKLKKQPEIITGAVEELLRYDSPVQMISRQSTETIEIAGETISPGQRIILCLGSANRDPEQFAEPDRLNLDREENQHLAFGGGIHRCLGAGLARTQIQIAINTMLDQLPELHLSTEKLEWHKRISLRSLKSLPVEFKS